MIVLAVGVDRDKDSAARYPGWLLLLREIIMTTMAAIRRMPPLMLGIGISCELYRLIARAIVRPVPPRFTIPDFCFDRPAGGGPFE